MTRTWKPPCDSQNVAPLLVSISIFGGEDEPSNFLLLEKPHLSAPGFSKLPPSSALEVTRSKPSCILICFSYPGNPRIPASHHLDNLLIWHCRAHISHLFCFWHPFFHCGPSSAKLSPQCLLGRLCEAFALADIQLSPKDTASLKTLYVLAVILPPLGLEVGGVRPLCLPSPRKPQLWSSCLDCPTCYSLSHPTSFLQTIIPGPLLHVMELKLHLCVCVYNFYIFWYPGLVVFDLLSSNEHVLFLKIILYDCQQQQLFHHLSYKHLISSFSLIWLFNWFI